MSKKFWIIKRKFGGVPDFTEQNKFILQTNASHFAIGAVLSNKDGRRWSLNKAEKNYTSKEND